MSRVTNRPLAELPIEIPSHYTLIKDGVLVAENFHSSPFAWYRSQWTSSVQTRGFRNLKSWERPVNPCQLGSERIQDAFVNFRRTIPQGDQNWAGSLFWTVPNAVPHSGLSGFDTNPAILEAERNLYVCASSGSVNLAVAFAERQQAAAMANSSVGRLLAFAGAVRRGKIKRAKSIAESVLRRRKDFGDSFSRSRRWPKDTDFMPDFKTFQNLWLELHFGWKPLLSDIYGSAELLANTFNAPSAQQGTRVIGSGSISKDDSWTTTLYGVTVEHKTKARAKARAVAIYGYEPSLFSSMQRTGLTNPLTLAWETLPFSFVVDWIYPLGSYFTALETPAPGVLKKGSISVLTKTSGSATVISNSEGYVGLDGARAKADCILLDRYPFMTWPSVSLPLINTEKINDWHGATAVSLLSQLFKRKP